MIYSVRAPHHAGFTVIETMVTVIVASLFIITINLLYVAIVKSSTADRNRAEASNIAYEQLRMFAYTGATPENWFHCSTATGTSNTNDLLINPNAAGEQIASGSLNDTQTTIVQLVTYSVRAYAPYGCNTSDNATAPILVRSTVTYGPNSEKVVHSAYVGY